MPIDPEIRNMMDAIKASIDALPKPAFYLWCEENGGLAANAYEWSWGNGAIGGSIGCPIMAPSQLTHMSLNVENFGTSVQINARKATTPGTGSIVSNPLFLGSNTVFELPAPVSFDVGDTLVCQTGALVGGSTDARVFFRFEEL